MYAHPLSDTFLSVLTMTTRIYEGFPAPTDSTSLLLLSDGANTGFTHVYGLCFHVLSVESSSKSFQEILALFEGTTPNIMKT